MEEKIELTPEELQAFEARSKFVNDLRAKLTIHEREFQLFFTEVIGKHGIKETDTQWVWNGKYLEKVKQESPLKIVEK